MSIFRRRLMMGGRKPIEYLEFEDRRVWEICAYRWGYTQNVQEIGGAGGVLDEGVIEGNNETIAFCGHIFAASYAIGAHGSVPATAARRVQYRVELYVNGSQSSAGAPWEIATQADTSYAAFVVQQIELSDTATDLLNVSLEKWADANYWASQTDLAYNSEKGCWECLVTTTGACQYIRIGLRAIAGVRVNYKVVSVGITKMPIGITSKQCEAVTSLGEIFKYNVVISNLIDLLNFTSITTTENNQFYKCTSIMYAICPPNLTYMRQRCFQGNTNLIVCTIPDSLVGFGDLCFYQSTKLKAIILFSVSPPTYNRTLNSTGSGKVYVPDDSVDTYKAATGWSLYAGRIYGHSQLSIDYPSYYDKYIHIYD